MKYHTSIISKSDTKTPKLVDDTVLDVYPDGGTPDNGEQAAWLAEVLGDTLDSTKSCYGYSVLINLHAILRPWTVIDSLFTSTDVIQDYVNNTEIPQIVNTFMNNGGKFITYLTGHAHQDFLCTPQDYPNQLLRSIGTSRVDLLNGDVAKVHGTNSEDLFEIVCINTNLKYITFYRIGSNCDRIGRCIESLVYDYENMRIVYER